MRQHLERVFFALENGRMDEIGMDWEYGDDLQQREEDLQEAGFDAYCLFSMTDSEIHLAQEFNYLNKNCLALPFLRIKRAREAGKGVLTQVPLLQGYVFIFVPKGYEVASLQRGEIAYRTLGRREGADILAGEDLEYAKWVLKQRGVLDVSKAIEINDRVKIISGPLLDLQGCIIGFSRRKKNYHVQFEMMGHTVDVWLPYELMEPAGEWRGKDG